jgi:hypothetical protein
MYRSSEVIREKTKIRVEMKKGDGSTMEGFVFVSGHERVLDLLNNREPFLPFEMEDGSYVMINKQVIASVWPHDEQWMKGTYKAAQTIEAAPMRRPVRRG